MAASGWTPNRRTRSVVRPPSATWPKIFCRESASRVRRVVPEDRRHELAAQALILGVLPPQHFRPLHGQFTAHAGEVIARSGIDEGDFARPTQRLRREERRGRGRPAAGPPRPARPRRAQSIWARSSARSWATRATASGSFGDPGWSRNQARASASMPWSGRSSRARSRSSPCVSAAASRPSIDEQRLVAGAERLPAVGAVLARRRLPTPPARPARSRRPRRSTTAARRGPSMRSRSQ